MTSSSGLVGPILHLRGERDGALALSLTLGSRGAPPTAIDGPFGSVAGRPIGAVADLQFAAYDFAVPLVAEAAIHRYRVEDRSFEFHVARRGGPLRLAYASCNGAEGENLAAPDADRNTMWRALTERHAAAPYHALTLGGDQIYADAVVDTPALRAWRELPRRERLATPFSGAMTDEAARFYADLYATVWRQPFVCDALATIPTVAMWDDHDIIDGWGSHPAAEQAAPVMQGLFAVARAAFAAFQLGVDPAAPGTGFVAPDGAHFSHALSYGPARIVVPDLRSCRTRRSALGPDGIARHHLSGLAETGRGEPALLFVSSVPMVNVDLSPLERVLAPFQRIADVYQDDLRDQWMSYAHISEWAAVIDVLLEWARQRGPVAVLSGEIHLAARGTAQRDGHRIAQFTASGIAHPAPPGSFAAALDGLARRPSTRAGVRLEMTPVAAGRRFLAERNFLEVEVATDGGVSARLCAERTGWLPFGDLRPSGPGARSDTRTLSLSG